MDVITTIDRASALGLRLAVVDGRLNVTGSKTAEAAALVRQLATMKAAIIAHLTAPPPPLENDRVSTETVTVTLSANDDSEVWTFGDTAPDLRNLPPIRNTTGKPSLPVDMWVSGLATFAEARRRQLELGEYGTALGQDKAGFFVRCPGWQWGEVSNAH